MRGQAAAAVPALLISPTRSFLLDLPAQTPAGDRNVTVNPSLFGGLHYRLLDFSRGGRVTAVAEVASGPLEAGRPGQGWDGARSSCARQN
jgi:hypothetical protein